MEGKSNLTVEFVRDVITPIIMNRFCCKFGNCEIDEITTDSTWRAPWTFEPKKNKIRIVLYIPARGRTFTCMCTSHVRIDLRDEEFDLPSGVQTRPVCHVWVRSGNSRWEKLLTVGPKIWNGQFLSISDIAKNTYTGGLAENEIFGRDNLLDIARSACEAINHAIERDLEVHARETAVTIPKLIESDCEEKKKDPIITLNFLHHVVAPCIIRELKKHFDDVRIIVRGDTSVLEGKLMRLPDGPNISSRYSVLIGFIDGRAVPQMRYIKLEYWRNCDLVDHSIIGDRNFIRVYATNNQLELVEIMHIGRRKLSDSSAPCRAVATATGGGLKFWDIDTTTMIHDMIDLINNCIDHNTTMIMFSDDKTLTDLGAVPFGLVACTLKNLFEDYAHPSKHYQRQCYKRDQEIIYYDDEQTFEKDPICPIHFGATRLPSGQINVWFIDPSYVGILVQEFHIHKNTDDDGPWAKVLNFWVPDIPEQFCNWKMREKINGLINEICAKINLVCSGYTVCDTPEQKFWSYFKGFKVKAFVDDLDSNVIQTANAMLACKQDNQTNEKTEDSDKLVIIEGKPSTAGRLRPYPEFLWRGRQVLTGKNTLMFDTERRVLRDLHVKKVSYEEWIDSIKRRIVEKTIDVNNIDLNSPGLVSSDDWGRLIHEFHNAHFAVDTEEIKQILRSLKEEKEMSEDKKNVTVYEPEVRVHWNRDTEYLLFNYVRIAMNKLIMVWYRTRSVQWKGVDHIESMTCASWETKTDPVYRVELVHHKDDDIMSFYEVDPKTGSKTQITRNAESFDKRFGRGFYAAVDGIYKAVSHQKTELQRGCLNDQKTEEKKEMSEDKKKIATPDYTLHYSTDKDGKKLVTMTWDHFRHLANTQYGMSLAETDAKGMIQDSYWNPKTCTATIIWVDGSKTMAKPMDGTPTDPEIGFAICIAKKFFKTQNQWRKWLSKVVKTGEASASKKKDKWLDKLTKQAWARLAAEGITDPTQDQVVSMIDKIDAENKAVSKAAKAKPAAVPAKKTTTPKKKGK